MEVTTGIQAAACSDIGPRKPVNQDSFYFASGMHGGVETAILAVADGVSNSYRGELCSELCTGMLRSWVDDTLPGLPGEKNAVVASLTARIVEIHETASRDLRSTTGRSASTLCVLLLFGEEWFCFNVGDSHAYRLVSGLFPKFDRLSLDQTTLVERERDGRKYMKSILTCCIGTRSPFRYEYSHGSWKKGDRFLVCSDGVYKTQSESSLRKLLGNRKQSAEAVSRQMVGAALSKGETDNITAVVAFC